MVELLIYIGLLSIFLTVLTSLFVSIFKLQLTTQSTSSLTQDTRFIIARMGYDIENAKNISVPSALGQTTNSLTFTDSGGHTFIYALNGGNLTLNGIPINGLDTSISSITFQMVGYDITKPTTVQVKFTINLNVVEESGPRSQIIQTTYGLR